MLSFLVFPLFMYLSGLISFSLNRKHLLVMLLSLEFIVLSLFYLIVYLLSFFCEDIYFSMIFISMAVCEGALGLSILVSMVRTHGSDSFQSFSSLW